MRQKVSPVQPRTPAQRAVRQNFALNTKLWSGTMTAADRAAWVAYATTYPYSNVFGDSSVLTGLAMSVAKNQILNQIGKASILTPPIDNSVTPIPIPTALVAASGDPVEMALTTPAQAAYVDTEYYIFATPALPAGRNPSESSYRYITWAKPSAAGTTIDFSTPWGALFGNGVAGAVVWAIVAQVSSTKGNVAVGTKLSAIMS